MKKYNLVLQILFLFITISGCSSLEDASGKGIKSYTSSSISFPRLGMWWPDPWEQSLDDIARYDWVILFPWMEEFIDPIKNINPDILLLTATNACELSYDATEDSPDNNQVLAIPPEWFLTQVGTILVEDVNTTETTFYIEKTSITNGKEVYKLFIPGDTVLVDGESVLVESVNEDSSILTVQRGFVRPASSHKAGTRIAAHITFWPNSWLLNLSTMGSLAVVDSDIGEESWANYNARFAAKLLSNPSWDGILLDRTDPNQSWLIGGSTARTIDPDQSNTLISDYSFFDKSWNEGLRQYERYLRELIGEKKLILANWGMENYDLLNGNNYEGFPLDNSDSYNENWNQTVFGSISNIGSYQEWLVKGQLPNLTMIETYEDDGGPEPTSNGSYDNPYKNSMFIPNYQKMRFGLTTALLGDGYFSYEINTNGHGSLGLLWFDEYDNSNQGRGYLGAPLGSAYKAIDIPLGKNILTGGDFETEADVSKWLFWYEIGNNATFLWDKKISDSNNASFRIDILETLGVDWEISLSYKDLAVSLNKEYTLTFWAKADRNCSISSWVMEAGDPWRNYLEFSHVDVNTEWEKYELTAIATQSDNNSMFQFAIGEQTGSVWLDNVQLQEGNQNVWRRDYEDGIVLVNATNTSRTIDLKGEFQKILGTQVPEINDGSIVTKIELQPYDGIILLRVGFCDVY